jgi:hypothetical protein
MNKSIVPELPINEAKKDFTANIEAWRNFAQRITKNPFVKAFLLERDGNRCSWCNCVLQQNKIIHHSTYKHTCTFNQVIKISSPTQGNPYKTRIVPDCKSCKEVSNDRFLNCMIKLVLVHGICNKVISEEKLQIVKSIKHA